MIIGSCPYPDCEKPLMIARDSRRGFGQHKCVHCKRDIWTIHSDEPRSYTKESFFDEFEIDCTNRTVRKKENSLIKITLKDKYAGERGDVKEWLDKLNKAINNEDTAREICRQYQKQMFELMFGEPYPGGGDEQI